MSNDRPHTQLPSGIFNVRPELNTEEALSNAAELLASAVLMGHDMAFSLDEPKRTKMLGITQLVEMAQMLVSQALDHDFPSNSE